MHLTIFVRAGLALAVISSAGCANHEEAKPKEAPKISAFSQQLAYCEAVYHFIATDLVRKHEPARARESLGWSVHLATANRWLNAEGGRIGQGTLDQFQEASEGQLYSWNYSPWLAYSAGEACVPYVEEGWNRAKQRGGTVDGKTMDEWLRDRLAAELRQIGIPL